jgi:hypothetical protein
LLLKVHPSKSYFAVAEKGVSPEIIVYEYPYNASAGPLKRLHGGTTTSYSTIQFSPKGNQLASVGSEPDFTLSVWEWERESILLRSKAFSQVIILITLYHIFIFFPFRMYLKSTSLLIRRVD